jgi:hypothetical protein
MSVQNYTELLAHKGHDIKIHTYYDENVAIECNDCFEVLLDFDNDEVSHSCPCGVEIDSNTDLCDTCAGTLCIHKNPTTNYECVMCIEEQK